MNGFVFVEVFVGFDTRAVNWIASGQNQLYEVDYVCLACTNRPN